MDERQRAREISVGRWQRAGAAIVLHNGPFSPAQRLEVARIHAGPRALFTGFTATQILGVTGWERDAVDLLAPAGTRLRGGCPVPVRLNLHGDSPVHREPGRHIEALPYALLRAAATFRSARPAAGLLAAAVQQCVTTAAALASALDSRVRTRHRAVLIAAVHDIDGGSQALSEIDFVRLCRRNGLPTPVRQEVRRERSGRRRYHDELALADALVLRFPSVVVRVDPALVVDQLRRALRL